jgi:hypothetical protein
MLAVKCTTPVVELNDNLGGVGSGVHGLTGATAHGLHLSFGKKVAPGDC